jgi:serine/threonine protein kinase
MAYYQPGEIIDRRFEIVGHPLLGGMGIVYLCYDQERKIPVVLKTIKADIALNSESRERFLQEGEVWVNLGFHQNIVRAYGVRRVNEGREMFVVLELIPKEEDRIDASLRSHLISTKRFSLEKALLFSLQIVWGMKYATSKIPGMVHRDLKPENILVSRHKIMEIDTNRVAITDFGLVSVFQQIIPKDGLELSAESIHNKKLTKAGMGTPLYMAPEQWKGAKVGVFTDIYAFGCILFEMVTGGFAFRGDTWQELFEAHCEHRISPYPDSIPTKIISILELCLARDPIDRYQDWGAIQSDLEKAYISLYGMNIEEPVINKTELIQYEQSEEGWSHIYLGFAFIEAGNRNRAIQHFGIAESIANETGDRRLMAAALNCLGESYSFIGNPLEAKKFLEQALIETKGNNDFENEPRIIGNLASNYESLGNVSGAIELHLRALELYKRYSNEDGVSSELINLGSCFHKQGKMQDALKAYENGLSIAQRIGNLHWAKNALGNIGVLHADFGKPELAIPYHEKALAISKQLGSKNDEAAELINLGRCYMTLNELEKGIAFCTSGLKIARDNGHYMWQANALDNLSIVYRRQGNIDKAIESLHEVLEIRRKVGDTRGEASTLTLIGNTYAEQGKTREAVRFYQDAIEIEEKIGDARGLSYSRFNLAIALFKIGDRSEALSFAETACSLANQIGLQEIAQTSFQLIAQIGFEAFRLTATPHEMQTTLEKNPILKEEQFIHLIEEAVQGHVSPADKSVLEKRLSWLKEIVKR